MPNRGFRNEESGGYLFISKAPADEFDDLALPAREQFDTPEFVLGTAGRGKHVVEHGFRCGSFQPNTTLSNPAERLSYLINTATLADNSTGSEFQGAFSIAGCFGHAEKHKKRVRTDLPDHFDTVIVIPCDHGPVHERNVDMLNSNLLTKRADIRRFADDTDSGIVVKVLL